MKLFNFTIIKLTSCLIIGILLSYHLKIGLLPVLIASVILIIGLIIFFFIAKKQIKKTIWFGVITYVTTIIVGILIHNLHDQKYFKNHYLNNESVINNSTISIQFKIRQLLKPNKYYNKYIVELINIDNTPTKGKLLLNTEIDSLRDPYNVDDILFTSTQLTAIKPPLNPNQFNYKRYLENQYIYRQITSESSSIYTIDSQAHTLIGYAHKLRKHINNNLKKHSFDPDVLAIINALILGQRHDLSSDTYQAYAKAGAIHILAVSGLHVGIILMMLNFILKPILHIKNGRFLKTLLMILLLWSFAFIAGLSASVTRAVTMFSLVAIAMHLKRPTNIYNTLAISVLFLILFKPMFIFNIGFQMSYLAVIAIVTIQPLLSKLWHPKWFILNYLWQIFTVTIAAQFGVLPISLYYFHQFPGLFILSNMILIPFLGIILGLGILIIILASFNNLPQLVADFYCRIISTMNGIISWVSKQEDFLFKDITFNMFHVVTSYLFVILITRVFINKTYKHVRLLLVVVLIVQSVLMICKFGPKAQEFIIFNKNRSTLLGHNSKSKLFISQDESDQSFNTIYKNYSISNAIKSIESDSIKSVYTFNNKTLLVIDSLSVYNVKRFKPHYILLIESPKINLKRLIDSLTPQLIIADGSNYKSYLTRWKATCEAKNIPFHQTNEKGAYIFKY